MLFLGCMNQFSVHSSNQGLRAPDRFQAEKKNFTKLRTRNNCCPGLWLSCIKNSKKFDDVKRKFENSYVD